MPIVSNFPAGAKPEEINEELSGHIGNKNNPHEVTAAQVGAAETVHTHATSDITDFPASMPASDVSDWAKADNKPTYTANEVGAVQQNAASTVAFAIGYDAGGLYIVVD